MEPKVSSLSSQHSSIRNYHGPHK